MKPTPLRLPPLTFFVVMALGIVAALLMGKMAGNGDYIRIGAIVAVSIGCVICLILKTRIWLLILFCWALTGQISLLPIPFNLRELAVLTVFGLFLVFYALKLAPKSHKAGWIDILVAVNVGYLGTVFLRNPVGVAAFGTGMVGGRPYFGVLIGLLAFWIFSRVSIDGKLAKKLPFILFLGPLLVSVLSLFTYYFPAAVPFIAPLYNGINVSSFMETQQAPSDEAGPQGTGRIDSLGPVGLMGILALSAYFRPASLLLPAHPVRCVLFFFSLIAVLLSGFRSSFMAAVAFLSLSSYFRASGKDLVRILCFAGAALAIVIVGNGGVFNLPLSMQRTLSFLPGHWDERAVEEAKASSEWRFEMWKQVWSSDKWIKSKAFGDGFGFTEYELKIMQEAAWGGTGFIGGATTESQMIQGAYHSGPLSAIRYVGVVGLALYLSFLIFLAARSIQLIKTAASSAFLPITLFVGLPLIFEPFNYLFIFGGFDSGLPNVLLSGGLLKMLETSMKNAGVGGGLAKSPDLPDVEMLSLPPRAGLRPMARI